MSRGRPPVDPSLIQPEGNEPQGVAREQFIHGLLEWSKLDDVSERERRMVGLMQALEAEEEGVATRVPWRVRHWRVLTGMAAMVAITALIFLGLPTRTSAEAIVQASLTASKNAGDRRYTVSVKPPRASEMRSIGTLDVRDADHVVIQARTPFGDQVTVGRNENGAWAIRPDGTVDTYPPRHMWPNWVNFGQSTVLLVSIDELMTWLQRSYTLTKGGREAVPGGDGTLCDRVTAAHKPGESPEPPRVELWVDPQTRVVRRMELHWIPLGGVERNGPAEGPGEGPGDGDARPEHEDSDRPPPPPEDPMGLGPGGPPPEGPMDPDMLPPPRGPEGADEPRGVNRPDGAPEDRPRMRPRPEMGGQPGRRPPPPGGPRRRGPRPEFLGGPPDFRHHPPPPTMIVFDLVPGASFEATWFDAASHAQPEQK
jgi:hypothetical protein